MSDETIWGCPEVVISAPTALDMQFTRIDNHLAAVVVDGVLRLEAGDGPTSLTQVVSLRAPISVAEGRLIVGYLQDLTIGVERSAGIRVLVVADLAGTLKTLEFDFGSPAAPLQDDQLRLVRVFSPQGLEAAANFGLGLPGPVADYTATISITIQRRTTAETGLVKVEGLDVFAILSPSPAATA